MASLESAMERMYGDINLTDELTDEDANRLLAWGAAEHERAAEALTDDEAFEDRASLIRKSMKRINSYVGGRTDYDEFKAKSRLGRITEGLFELGYTISGAQIDALIAAQSGYDDAAMLTALLAWGHPTAPEESPTTAAPSSDTLTESDTSVSDYLSDIATLLGNQDQDPKPADNEEL
ncbi:MAG: hypothetical protein AAF125_17665 [Chloroflexota bacterium]